MRTATAILGTIMVVVMWLVLFHFRNPEAVWLASLLGWR